MTGSRHGLTVPATSRDTKQMTGKRLPPEDELVRQLRCAGYKITPARLAVLDVIRSQGEHLNPHEVLRHAQAIYPNLGRATVYRTLELLTQLGIVRPIYFGEQSNTYIRAEGGHHHLICSACGAVVEFEECIAESMEQELQERFGFRIRSHLLEFYGLCPKCQEN